MSGKLQTDDRCRYLTADGRRCAITLHGSGPFGGMQTILEQAAGTPGHPGAAHPSVERK